MPSLHTLAILDWPQIGIILAFLGSAGVGGIFVAVFNRRGKLIDDRTAEAKQKAEEAKKAAEKAVEDSAEVRQAKIAAEERLYENNRKEIHRILDDAQARITKLEERAERTEVKLEHLRGNYVKVFMIAERQVFQIRSLVDFIKSLLDRIPGDKPRFDEAPFLAAESELARLSPEAIFAPVAPTSEKTITARITLPPSP